MCCRLGSGLHPDGRCPDRTGDLLLVRGEQLLRSTAASHSDRSANDGPHVAAALCCGLPLPRRFHMIAPAFTRERHSRDQPEGLSPAGEFRNVEESNSVGAPEGTGSGALEGSELNMTDDEEQIRRLIERWAEAVHGGDLSGVLADHSDDKQRHS